MGNHNNGVYDLASQILGSVIASSPVVDFHTHIRPTSPAALDLPEILFYTYIVTALQAAGVSPQKIQDAKTPEEKIELFISRHELIANTAAYWCLRQVLRGLDLGPDVLLTVDSLTDASRKVCQTSSSARWPRELLMERHNIRKTFLTLSITEEIPAFDLRLFAGALRLDNLLSDLSLVTLQQFEKVRGLSLGNLSSFEHALGAMLTSFAASGGLTITAAMPPEQDYVSSDPAQADGLFAKVRRGESLGLADRAVFHSYLLRFFVHLAEDLHLPVQLMLGVRRPIAGGIALPVVEPNLVIRFADLFYRCPETRFDLILASVSHSQELIAVAQNYRNVSIAGHWWYAFSPPYIRNMLTERLLALPVTKTHAFFSDAYNVEWSIGKLALLRRELSWVLAELIVSGYLSESRVPEVARALLYDNPAHFYAISDLN
jgi:glucuronate isomerase